MIKKKKRKKLLKKQQEKMMEQQRLVHWCDANGPGNWKGIHFEEFENKYEATKNKSYY